MLFAKNKKSSGIISILALALAVTMLVVVCMTGCTDSNAQAAADAAQATATDAKTVADAAKAKAEAAATPADIQAALANIPAGVTMEQVNAAITNALADYLKSADAVTQDAVNTAINNALAPYAKTADVLTAAQVNTAIDTALNNALAAYQKTNEALTEAQVQTLINNALADYQKTADALTADAVAAQINNALEGYITEGALAEALAAYYDKDEIDGFLADVQGGVAADYLTIDDWDAATELWFAYQDAVAAGEEVEFLAQYMDEAFAAALGDGPSYQEMWDQLATSLFAEEEYEPTDGDDVNTVADFIEKYYDVADNDASGVAGDSAADYTLKMDVIDLHVRIRNAQLSSNATDLLTDMVAMLAKDTLNAQGEALFADLIAAGEAIEDPALYDGVYLAYHEYDENGEQISGYKVNSTTIEAVTAANTAISEYADDIDGAHNLYGYAIVVRDPVTGEYTDDMTDYGRVNATTANEARDYQNAYDFLYDSIIGQQEIIVTNNPTVADISIDTDDDEDDIVVLVGSAEFDPTNETEPGLYNYYSTINDGDLDPVTNDNSAIVDTYVYRIKELKFIKAQNQAYLRMAADYDQFLADNGISPASDLCLGLSRIAVKYQDWCMEFDYADVKKDTQTSFSFNTMITDMHAELEQYFAANG